MAFDPDGTYLHVVYAGQGDAFILEYTVKPRRHMVLMDGGPLTVPGAAGLSPPYWKYYFNAAAAVWDQVFIARRLILNNSIASHADEDHLGGLRHLLERSLENNEIDLLGSFLIPAHRKSKSNEFQELAAYLTSQGAGKPNLQESRGFEVAGLKLKFPPEVEVACFKQPVAPAPPVPKPKEVKDFNEGSLLVETDSSLAAACSLIFTGDSDATTIESNVLRPRNPPRHFSVYKIQHHGSIKDSQLTEVQTKLTKGAKSEIALCALLHCGAKGYDPEDNQLPEGTPTNAITWLFEQFCQKYNFSLLPGQDQPIEKFLEKLSSRNDQYFAFLQTFKAQKAPISPEDITNPAWPATSVRKKRPTKLWEELISYPDGTDENSPIRPIFFEPTNSKPRPGKALAYGSPKTWFTELKKGTVWVGSLGQYANVPYVEKFFKLFTADVYVVSANFKNKHPSAATLIGLARAVASRGQLATKPILFMTTGDCIDTKLFEWLAGEYPVKIADVLDVRVLKHGRSIMINAANNALVRDIHMRTEVLTLPDHDQLNRPKWKKQLETDTTVLVDERRSVDPLAKNWKVHVGGDYLQLQAAGARPTMIRSPANPILTHIIDGIDYKSLDLSQAGVGGVMLKARAYWDQKKNAIGGTQLTYRISFDLNQFDNTQPVGTFFEFYFDLAANPQTYVFEAAGQVRPTKQPVYFSFSPDPPRVMAPLAFDLASVDKPATFGAYCTSMNIDIATIKTTKDAIEAISRDVGFEGLNFKLGYQKAVLSFPPSLDASTVTYDDRDVEIKVTSATIVSSVPANTNIEIGQSGNKDVLQDLTALTELKYADDQSLTAKMILNLDSSVGITSVNVAPFVPRHTPLIKIFEDMGGSNDQLIKACVPKLVAFAIGDASIARQMFMGGIPSVFLEAGLNDVKADFKRSFGNAQYLPTGLVQLEKADIALDISNNKLSESALSAVGIKVTTIKEVFVRILDANLPTQSIWLYASCILGSNTSVSVDFSVESRLDATSAKEVHFKLTKTPGLQTTTNVLPGAPDLGILSVPFFTSTLSKLPVTSAGFSIRQTTDTLTQYDLASVFLTTKFDDWKSFLPASLTKFVADASIEVSVFDPLNNLNRSVAVKVDFSIMVTSSKPNVAPIQVDMELYAEPLSPNDYEYGLIIQNPDVNLRIADLASAVGLNSLGKDITGFAPIVGKILDSVNIAYFSLTIERTGGVSAFKDWSLSLNINELRVIEKMLEIRDVNIEISRVTSDWGCSVNGYITIGDSSSSHRTFVSVELPTIAAAGSLSITDSSVTPTNVMSIFKVPSQDEQPVVGSVLADTDDSFGLSLRFAKIELSKQTDSTSVPVVTGISLEITCDKLDIGPLHLQQIGLEFSWFTASNSFHPNKEGIFFKIGAVWVDGSLQASIVYDSIEDSPLIYAVLRPFDTPVKISDILAKILPSSLKNALDSLIGGLRFDETSLSLETGAKNQIQSFDISLLAEDKISVQSLSLTALKIHYQAAKGDDTKESFIVSGSVKKNTFGATVTVSCISDVPNKQDEVTFSLGPAPNSSLSLTGLLDLFSLNNTTLQYEKPASVNTNFFDLNVTEVKGTFQRESQDGKNSLDLKSFTATIVSQDKLILQQSPLIALQDITLRILYEAGPNQTLSGFIEAHFIIGVADVIVKYMKSKDSNEHYFDGQLTLSNHSLELSDLSTSLQLDTGSIERPHNLTNIPQHLLMGRIGVTVYPGRRIQLFAVGQQQWNDTCTGLAIKSSFLGALVRVDWLTLGNPPTTTKTVDAYITGVLDIAGFASNGDTLEAVGRLSIVKLKPNLLTASIVPKTGQSDQVDLLSGNIDSASAWKALGPKDVNQIDFSKTGAWVKADFTENQTPSVVVVGNVASIGYTVFLRKQSSPSRNSLKSSTNYFFAFGVSDISLLFKNIGDSTTKMFTIDSCCLQISNYNTIIGDLSKDIDAMKIMPGIDQKGLQSTIAPSSTLDKDTAIKQGTTFFLRITLDQKQDSKEMGSALTMAANSSSTISMYAYIDAQKDSSQSEYHVLIKDLTIFGGDIVLNASGSYKPVEKLIDLSGSMKVTVIKNTLYVKFFTKPNETSWLLSTESQQEAANKAVKVQNPLEMFNVELSQISFTGKISKDTNGKVMRTYKLTGLIRLGNEKGGNASLTGSIEFEDGRPRAVLAWLSVDNFSILDLFSQIIKPNDGGATTGTWPSDFDIFQMQSIRMYYVPGDQDFGEYKKGYHMSASFTLWRKPFSVFLTIQREGVILAAEYKKVIDLDFVKLVGYTPTASDTIPKSDGVQLGVDTIASNPSYYIAAGLKVLDLDPLSCALKYTHNENNEPVLQGTVSYSGKVFGANDSQVSIEVEYDIKTHKWSLKKFPFVKEVSQAIQALDDAISKGTKGTTCGEIVQMIQGGISQLITTAYHFEFNISTDPEAAPTPNHSVKGVLKWSYDISVIGYSENPVSRIELGQTDVDVPIPQGGLNWDTFWKWVESFIKENAANIGRALFEKPKPGQTDNRAGLVKLLTIIGVTKILPGVLADLLCRDIKGDNDEILDEAEVQSNAETANIEGQCGTAAGGSGAVGAFGAAAGLEAAVDALAALAAVLYGASGLFALLAGLSDPKGLWMRTYSMLPNTKQQAQDAKKKSATDKVNSLKDKETELRNTVGSWLALSKSPSAQFLSGSSKNTIIVDWTDALPLAPNGKLNTFFTGWNDFVWETRWSETPQIPPDTDPNLVSTQGSISQCTLPNSDWTFVRQVYIWTRARYKYPKAGLSDPVFIGPWKDCTASHMPKLSKPLDVGIQSSSDTQVISCTVSYDPHASMETKAAMTNGEAMVQITLLGNNSDPWAVQTPDFILRNSQKSFDIISSITGQQILNVLDFTWVSDPMTSLKPVAKLVPKDATHFIESDQCTTNHSLRILPVPSFFSAQMDSRNINIQCEQDPNRPCSYLLVIQDGTSEIFRKAFLRAPFSITTTKMFSQSVMVPSLHNKQTLTISFSQIGSAPYEIGMVTHRGLFIDMLPPAVHVLDESYYSTSTSTLFLFMSLEVEASPKDKLVMRLTYASDTGTTETIVSPQSASMSGKTATITDSSPAVKLSGLGSIEIAVIDSTNHQSTWSVPWKFEAHSSEIELKDVSSLYYGANIDPKLDDVNAHKVVVQVPHLPAWNQLEWIVSSAGAAANAPSVLTQGMTNVNPDKPTDIEISGSSVPWKPDVDYLIDISPTRTGLKGPTVQIRMNIPQIVSWAFQNWRGETLGTNSNIAVADVQSPTLARKQLPMMWTKDDGTTVLQDEQSANMTSQNFSLKYGSASTWIKTDKWLCWFIHAGQDNSLSVWSTTRAGMGNSPQLHTTHIDNIGKVDVSHGGTIAAINESQIFFVEKDDSKPGPLINTATLGLGHDGIGKVQNHNLIADSLPAALQPTKNYVPTLVAIAFSAPTSRSLQEVFWVDPTFSLVGAIHDTSADPGAWVRYTIAENKTSIRPPESNPSIAAVHDSSSGTFVFWRPCTGGINVAFRSVTDIAACTLTDTAVASVPWTIQSVSFPGTECPGTALAAAVRPQRDVHVFWYGGWPEDGNTSTICAAKWDYKNAARPQNDKSVKQGWSAVALYKGARAQNGGVKALAARSVEDWQHRRDVDVWFAGGDGGVVRLGLPFV